MRLKEICSVCYTPDQGRHGVVLLICWIAKSKKQRQKAAKAMRKLEKQRLLHPELLEPKVPLYEQSIDLPFGDGSVEGARVADKARDDLTKSMREKRRAKIKEDNFLRTM